MPSKVYNNQTAAVISNIIMIAVNAMVFAYTFQLKKCECLVADDKLDVNKDWKYHYIVYYSIITTCVFSLILLLRLFNVNLVPKNKALIVLLGTFAAIFMGSSVVQAYTLFFFMKKIHLQHEVDEVLKEREEAVEDCSCRDRIEMYIIYYYSVILFVLYTVTFIALFMLMITSGFN
tara:strand:- start:7399 stop:7926 length:528 start_codon:yes stop_codon:yes gene_type:complete